MSTKVFLPNDPILVKLLEAAVLTEEQVIFDRYGFQKTYSELLGDVIATRNLIRDRLPTFSLTADGLLAEHTPYLAALTHGGYEFVVAFFAIRAIGGACFPFSAAILPEEARHYLNVAQASGILAGAGNLAQAKRIRKVVDSVDFFTLPISTNASPVSVHTVGIDESLSLDPQGPGVVMCTSGTTGIPKAAVLPRQCLVQTRPAALGKANLSYRPPHWRGGFASAILPVISGHKLFSLKQQAEAWELWEMLRSKRITLLIFNPVLLRRMREFYEAEIAAMDDETRSEYILGFRNLGSIRCSGAFLAPGLKRFWTDLTGLPFKNAYGQTECGSTVTEVDFTVGQVVTDHDVEVKLSSGTHGEFLVKSDWMMTEYLGNKEATRAAFDHDGYLKTGDVGYIADADYVFQGRANDDFIGRIPRIPVELAINSLPYVAEGHVLLVPDYEERAVCGAVVRLKQGTLLPRELTLARLHEDLSATVPTYMRPYLLRVLSHNEEIPYTASQKPNKPVILDRFFGVKDFWPSDAPTPGVQVWHMRLSIHSEPTAKNHMPWDFASW
ncbi:hypothetical protein HIM_04080 [Hirsutella minnesotensis 3608]|uniref:AMP-dependent synthetase/ligase domain-containing protein n=1 Tax=Hirsutella minnesotensis 3608 TaxID=1043627 RepID=A0A0F7ZLG0_9HYPO|nr:hypothetical protein HIM_04080 [Hirsutella minnesotensis 3608]